MVVTLSSDFGNFNEGAEDSNEALKKTVNRLLNSKKFKDNKHIFQDFWVEAENIQVEVEYVKAEDIKKEVKPKGVQGEVVKFEDVEAEEAMKHTISTIYVMYVQPKQSKNMIEPPTLTTQTNIRSYLAQPGPCNKNNFSHSFQVGSDWKICQVLVQLVL